MSESVVVKGIDIHTYFVKDLERARQFYLTVLGLTNVDGKQYEFELPDGSTFGLYKPQPGDGVETWQRGFGIMFAVEDAYQAVIALRKRGVRISEALERPTCLMAFGEDSEGNQIIIHQRK
ncbi:MAG: VOC family protein [Candidatus Eremiobacteraeota bacterium]|nr:VOC family protein [Candidatus Eremiobacteraeota bacterium]